MTSPTELDALLERAVQIEVKTATAEAAILGRELTADAAEDLAAQTREALDGEIDEQVVADLEARLEAIDAHLAAQQAAAPQGVDGAVETTPAGGEPGGWDISDDEVDAGMDFDEPDTPEEVKSLGCRGCGSHDVDELANGATQCGGCGLGLSPATEAKDFDDLEVGDTLADELGVGLDLEAGPETKAAGGLVELSEVELLRGHRLGLTQD